MVKQTIKYIVMVCLIITGMAIQAKGEMGVYAVYDVISPNGSVLYNDIEYGEINGCLYLSDIGLNKIDKISYDFNYYPPSGALIPINTEASVTFNLNPLRIDLSNGNEYLAVAFIQDLSEVGNEWGEIKILDASDLTEINSIYIERMPRDLTFSKDDQDLYVVAGLASDEEGIIRRYSVPSLGFQSEMECGADPIAVATSNNYVFVTNPDIFGEGDVGIGDNEGWDYALLWVYDLTLSNYWQIKVLPNPNDICVGAMGLYVAVYSPAVSSLDEGKGIVIIDVDSFEKTGELVLAPCEGGYAIDSNDTIVASTVFIKTPPPPGLSASGIGPGDDIYIIENDEILMVFNGEDYALEEIYAVAVRNNNSVFCLCIGNPYVYNLFQE